MVGFFARQQMNLAWTDKMYTRCLDIKVLKVDHMLSLAFPKNENLKKAMSVGDVCFDGNGRKVRRNGGLVFELIYF